MRRYLPGKAALVRCEFGTVVLLTLFLVFLHLRLLWHAGPLWRDEIDCLYPAATPSFHELRTALIFNPFPIFFSAILRAWLGFGFGHDDFALRILGFLIGLLLLGAIWLSCRWIDRRWAAPLWPLAMFGARAMTITDGDSLRPYGLGMITVFLTFGLICKITFGSCRIGTIAAAGIAAILCVQSLYLNAFIVLGIALAGIVVALRRREFATAGVILAVGIIAAASLLPYLGIVSRAHELWPLQREEHGISETSHFCLWLIFAAAGLALIPLAVLLRRLDRRLSGRSDELLFALIAVAIASIATLAFLWTSGVPGSRHVLPLLALASLSIHIFSEVLLQSVAVRFLNLIAVVIVAAVVIPGAYARSGLRRTDCDLAASAVAQRSNENDLAIVMRFTHAITFARYYHGPANWKSIPDVADHRQHRWDLAMDAMRHPDSISGVLSVIESILKSGHKVFLVGRFPKVESEPVPLPPAPESKFGWRLFAYQNNWDRQISFLLRAHAIETASIVFTREQRIDPREHEEVFQFSGWRD